MRASIGYLAAAALLLSLSMFGLAIAQQHQDQGQHRRERLVGVAQTIAAAALVEDSAENPELELGRTQRAVSTTATAVPSLTRILVLKGTRFLAHSDKTRAGTSLKRDSAEDKALYDQAARIKAAIKKSEEQAIEISEDKSGALSVAIPARSGAGDFVALVVVSGNPVEAPEPLSLALTRGFDNSNVLKAAIGLWLLALVPLILSALGLLARARRALREHRNAYAYLSPAILGMSILVAIPVLYGIGYSFGERRYNVWSFEGLSNYIAILSDFAISQPENFYFKLAVTMMWTLINVSLHLLIGLFLALLLNDTMLKARGVYRVILVVPWAVPNYITALIWKGMFHKQFGAINFFLEAMGVEPVAWFQSFWPAFSANVATNTWLGFPFMMLISLGALQSIPADLYEAAEVDGAQRWQRFRHITLPLLMPALVPAVMVGTVWTFNMFNIIYLVSAGAPNNATDILVTDAFRWAFERDRYGYAAAYSTIIFVILLLNTLLTNRITKATKGAFE